MHLFSLKSHPITVIQIPKQDRSVLPSGYVTARWMGLVGAAYCVVDEASTRFKLKKNISVTASFTGAVMFSAKHVGEPSTGTFVRGTKMFGSRRIIDREPSMQQKRRRRKREKIARKINYKENCAKVKKRKEKRNNEADHRDIFFALQHAYELNW